MSEAFQSNYFKASDIKDAGNSLQLTIAKVDMAELGQGQDKEVKPVMEFEGEEKGIVLNKTNFSSCAAIFNSEDSDDWIGGDIILTTRMVEYQGKVSPAIRVDIEASSALQPGAAPAPVKQARQQNAGRFAKPANARPQTARDSSPEPEDGNVPY